MTNLAISGPPDPAASEPNSISPTAVDVNLWEIDLTNLRSGARLDLAVPVHVDPEPTMLVPRVKRRAARRVLGVMISVVLVGGLGLATFLARPSVERAFASASARSRAAKANAVAQPPPPVAASAAPMAPPIFPPVSVPIKVAEPVPAPAVPTLSANDLPNAPKQKNKLRGAKRSAK